MLLHWVHHQDCRRPLWLQIAMGSSSAYYRQQRCIPRHSPPELGNQDQLQSAILHILGQIIGDNMARRRYQREVREIRESSGTARRRRPRPTRKECASEERLKAPNVMTGCLIGSKPSFFSHGALGRLTQGNWIWGKGRLGRTNNVRSR